MTRIFKSHSAAGKRVEELKVRLKLAEADWAVYGRTSWLGKLAVELLAGDWLDAKIRRPLVSFFRLRDELPPHHDDALHWLAGDAPRWYAALAALHEQAHERCFLARSVNFPVEVAG